MAVAIDGEIFQDACLAQLNPDSEIYLITIFVCRGGDDVGVRSVNLRAIRQ